MRSNVTVGNGAEVESVAKFSIELEGAIFLGRSALGIGPESSIDAAAVVVETIASAAGGSGWL